MGAKAYEPRITKVEPISLFVPLAERIEAPISVPHADALTDVIFRGYRATLVRIETDLDVTGMGSALSVRRSVTT